MKEMMGRRIGEENLGVLEDDDSDNEEPGQVCMCAVCVLFVTRW